jgi:hypothetical protein
MILGQESTVTKLQLRDVETECLDEQGLRQNLAIFPDIE